MSTVTTTPAKRHRWPQPPTWPQRPTCRHARRCLECGMPANVPSPLPACDPICPQHGIPWLEHA